MGIKRRRLNHVRTSTKEKVNHQAEINENAINFEKEFLDTSHINGLQNGYVEEVSNINQLQNGYVEEIFNITQLQNGYIKEMIENMEKDEQRTLNETYISKTDTSLTLKIIKKNWGLKGVYQKLKAIWNSSSNKIPITMEVLCVNVTKQEAVVAFSTLLHLSAKRYVILIKDLSTNFIADIKPGQIGKKSVLPKRNKKLLQIH